MLLEKFNLFRLETEMLEWHYLFKFKTRAREDTLNDNNMYMTSISDRYRNRPKGEPFDCMCFATFCSEYRIMSKSENPNVNSKKIQLSSYKMIWDILLEGHSRNQQL